MRKFAAFLVAIAFPTTGTAQLAQAPNSASVPQTPSSGAPLAAPQFQNDCTHFYPQTALAAAEQGLTVLAVHIAKDGTIQNPHVAQSSGYPDLDQAALSCVSGNRVPPMKSGGTAIDADTQISIVWQRSYFSAAPGPRWRSNVCSSNVYPPIAVRQNHQGEVDLSFTIGANGNVKDIVVTRSSGYDELDQAATRCVSQFLYQPATRQGQPIEIDGKTNVFWRLAR